MTKSSADAVVFKECKGLIIIFQRKPFELDSIQKYHVHTDLMYLYQAIWLLSYDCLIIKVYSSQAVLNSSFTHHSRMSAEIAGSKGRVTLQPRFHETQGFEMTIEGVSESIGLSTTGRGYYHEIVEVNQCIRDGKMESELW